jgi:predicted transcriptional regulator
LHLTTTVHILNKISPSFQISLHFFLFAAIVHFMNDKGTNEQDTYRSLLLMSELEEGKPISQREIAGRMGIALGLVNSYLKALVSKGFVTVKAMPRNRYAYLLTPRGFAEKSRLAYQHLSNFHKLYRITRQDSLKMFCSLREQGVKRVSFCGLDDYTEIAYLSLQEAGLELAAVMDKKTGSWFIHFPVVSLEDGLKVNSGAIVITTLPRAEELKRDLRALGVEEERIYGPSLSYEEALGGA